MVLVYPSITAAEGRRAKAYANEGSLNAGRPVDSQVGPHLVIGYGPSVWEHNVALVQTTQTLLDRLYQMQIDRDNCADIRADLAAEYSLPNITVDAEFQRALQAGAVNL